MHPNLMKAVGISKWF